MPEPDLSRGAYIIDRSIETLLADRVETADGVSAAATRAFALPDRGSEIGSAHGSFADRFPDRSGRGLRPLRRELHFGTGSCTATLTRGFFRRQRTYKGAIDTGAMPEPGLARGAYISDRSTETLFADRVRTADGGSAASTRAFALPDRGSVPACEAVCKTRSAKANTDAAPAGVVGAQQTSPTGFATFYRSEAPTSELQSLMRITHAVFRMKKKKH